jgi:hypothetical protein
MARSFGCGDNAVTIALRPLLDADAAWLDGWLAPVAASVGYDEIDVTRPGASLRERAQRDGGVRATVIVRDGADAGLAVYRRAALNRGSAIIEIVATPPASARKGSGMMAAALIEEELRTGGVRSLYAPAPAAHGITMYFWIRLGYRPLLRGQWPCERDGVAWLVREL